MNPSPTLETFVHAVHRALHHLYDPVELRLNPLAGWLGITHGDVPSGLRTRLLNGIAALKPGQRVLPDSNAWRVYQVLCYRFEEQSSQEDVAVQMAISSRQVRRLEYTAIRALSSHLIDQHGLSPDAKSKPEKESPPESSLHENELDFLRKTYPRETTDVSNLVDTALKTVEGMLKTSAKEIQVEVSSGLPPVLGQATTLRQVLLNLLLAAIQVCNQGSISVAASKSQKKVCIDVIAKQGGPIGQSSNDVSEFIVLARRLAELSEGTIDLLTPTMDQILAVRLSLPVTEQIRILFVDDNEDSLHLFERFLDGTRFLFYSTHEPHSVLTVAEEVGCQIIVLDIMLPDIDGWEILGRIRAHPRLGAIPTIISTILPHEALASSMGAAGFLRKPVTREALLTTLNYLSDSLYLA